ncbi:P-loop containing nucleoside triphosphate hydrolase protein [Lentinula edodes]|uniref:P-loop containing nucleoside triphosphate hydrolase protein n=1 Tax=Lentinula edodes TaxID=5353 RepID=UPI001E8CEA8F|nr:P-loop containing nucleoside triphosphate hydrolase protein [Lentinula edodes]KAH7874644.1 P-loop containing nucleoside triphosphate hydrolase protein [Lentinula edodes]
MDDDGLVLNLASEDFSSSKASISSKGGRWTDRLKAKRGAKRKNRNEQPSNPGKPHNIQTEIEEPQRKRPRVEKPPAQSASKEHPHVQSHPPTQIISSLFSYNPKVQTPVNPDPSKVPSAPSNAPLTDASSFSGLGLNPLISAHLSSKMGIQKPTSIQRAALPVTLSVSPDVMARDIFIQSQTGSGKTLSFLLPIIQDLLPLSSLSYIDRSLGTLAIIIVPTRELAKQISDVLESLLYLRLRATDESADDSNTVRLTRWLVSGLLIGGGTRTHEKARLRKGLPILVATPGRLLDHLQNTSTFNVSKCRWLVLDEADRLMELGFEESITGILKCLDGHRKLALQAVREGIGKEVGGWDWERRRRTILCSATIREDVQKLANTTLTRPIMIKATEVEIPSGLTTSKTVHALENFSPPSQLSQKYVITPLKLRLVVLVALLRNMISQRRGQPGSKAIVFLSCTDAVDFLWKMLGGSLMDGEDIERAEQESNVEDNSDDVDEGQIESKSEQISLKSSLLPDTSVFRLHGSLPTQTRLATLRGFSGSSKRTAPFSVLLCTSVASRGLDLPLVWSVIQYDLPTEGGATEYVHRVGRTARAGKGGEAWSFVSPSEVAWVQWVEGKMRSDSSESEKQNISLIPVTPESVLKLGFGGKGSEYEERATQVQLSFERWVLRSKENAILARKAFMSHMRAYATHPSAEKHIFHIRHLHLGHLAKAFALRETPKAATSASGGKSRRLNTAKDGGVTKKREKDRAANIKGEKWEITHSGDAERRMRDIVRAQGRHSKKGGVMMSSGSSEFQIAGGYDLEKMVGGM